MNFYECKVRYNRPIENGLIKIVTDVFLVDATSHTDAEALFVKEITPYIHGEFEVIGIKPAKIAEIFVDDKGSSDGWYKVRLAFLTINERNGLEKRDLCTMMVQADDLNEAAVRLSLELDKSTADYKIISICESKVLDIFIGDSNEFDQ